MCFEGPGIGGRGFRGGSCKGLLLVLLMTCLFPATDEKCLILSWRVAIAGVGGMAANKFVNKRQEMKRKEQRNENEQNES